MHKSVTVILLVLCILGCTTSRSRIGAGYKKSAEINQRKRRCTMDPREQIASMLKLSHEEFFQDDETRLFEYEQKLALTDFECLAINAPKLIDTESQTTLPVALAIQRNSLREWEVLFQTNAILVAANLDTGDVKFGSAFASSEKRPVAVSKSRQGPAPDEDSATTQFLEVLLLDAKAKLGLPWKPNKFAISVISYDWVSNTVQVELQSDDDMEGVTARPVFPPPNLSAGAPVKKLFGSSGRDKMVLPSYLPNSKTPKLTSPGLTLAIEANPAPGGGLIVNGAFSTTAKEYHIPQKVQTHRFDNAQQYNVAAVVPLTFVIVGLDWPVPVQLDWAIPVYSNQTIEPGAPLQGCFALDALAGAGVKLPADNYLAYAVLEGTIYGPAKFKWASPSENP
ncbi:MAG: hypothetical protein ACYTFK_07020 [Planctomycetota bacterium]